MIWRLITLILVNRLGRRWDLRDLLEALIGLWLIVVGKGLIGLRICLISLRITLMIVNLRSLNHGRIVFWWISRGLMVDKRLIGDLRVEVVLI